ncbi:MAG: hypothetical protein IPM38_10545 [Ignavibacteria bacterium]|nr:hypothetical protein [Ignavibacteria bacterium]
MVLVSGDYRNYTGDVNQDDVVDLSDVAIIDNDAFNFATGYIVSDLNYDLWQILLISYFADNNAFGFVQVEKP